MSYERVFHGKLFKDNQVTKVYRLKRNALYIDDLRLQKEEIESVMWMEYEACLRAVQGNTIKHCIFYEELRRIKYDE